jgi:hypothetical protein
VEVSSSLGQLQAAFGAGVVLGGAVFFVLGILVGLAWATMKNTKEVSQ